MKTSARSKRSTSRRPRAHVSAQELVALKRRFLKEWRDLRICFICPAASALRAVREGEPQRLVDFNGSPMKADAFLRMADIEDLANPGGP